MTQAVRARDWTDRVRHQMRRSDVIDASIQRRADARTNLIYTRQGVLDMTRRHKLEQVVIDRFGQRIGGARTW